MRSFNWRNLKENQKNLHHFERNLKMIHGRLFAMRSSNWQDLKESQKNLHHFERNLKTDPRTFVRHAIFQLAKLKRKPKEFAIIENLNDDKN
jgi:hypothetical protein